MKKVCLIVCISASLLILVSASVWEGAATMSRDLPETGLYMATNSFPINSVVEVTNLENGKTTRLIVYTGLDTAGFLALLSTDASNALEIPYQSLGRVRMSQVSDLLALSRFTEGRALRREGDTIELTMLPTEARPPVDEVTIDPSLFIPPVYEAPVENRPALPVIIDPSYIIAAVPPEAPPVAPPPIAPPPVVTQPIVETPPPPVVTTRNQFIAPTIRTLEMGKYYVQIVAFSNAEAVNPEISRIDRRLPITVMDAGTQQSPLYRILIGPLTLGEAGAMVHRFRSTHSDAFVRVGE